MKKEGLYILKYYFKEQLKPDILRIGFKIGYTTNITNRMKSYKRDGYKDKPLVFFECDNAKFREDLLKSSHLFEDHFRMTRSEWLGDDYSFRSLFEEVKEWAEIPLLKKRQKCKCCDNVKTWMEIDWEKD